MRSQFEDNGMGPDVGDVIARVSEIFRKNLRRIGPLIVIIIVVAVAMTGFYSVGPGEVGVVRTFGKADPNQKGPGLHFRFPLVQQVDIVNTEKVRHIQVGYRDKEIHKEEAQMLTGDENIVDAQLLIQYRVVNPNDYLFRLKDPEETLHVTTEVALRSVVGTMTIDDVITEGRSKLQDDTRALLQRLMNEYKSGLEITDVKLQDASAPNEVKDAFNEVVRAREKKEQLINEANGYNEDQLPKARGKQREIERSAEAYKEERIVRARGDVAKFVAIYDEYKTSRDVTRERLYLEAMERILTGVDRKILIDEDVSRGTLPVLPLGAGALEGGAKQ
ncbi:MAG: FtsH protease activity modulator HflK [Polyangiaceae bacterium]|nr:FtsH protease activity modulator HflK [Polyangiaceae bacterium]